MPANPMLTHLEVFGKRSLGYTLHQRWVDKWLTEQAEAEESDKKSMHEAYGESIGISEAVLPSLSQIIPDMNDDSCSYSTDFETDDESDCRKEPPLLHGHIMGYFGGDEDDGIESDDDFVDMARVWSPDADCVPALDNETAWPRLLAGYTDALRKAISAAGWQRWG